MIVASRLFACARSHTAVRSSVRGFCRLQFNSSRSLSPFCVAPSNREFLQRMYGEAETRACDLDFVGGAALNTRGESSEMECSPSCLGGLSDEGRAGDTSA